MTNQRRWITLFAALTLAVLAAGTAIGYSGEVAQSVTVSRPTGTLTCGVNITVTATIQDAQGKPIADQPVAWSWSSRVTSADRINDAKDRTNSKGIAKTTVNLACVPGSRVLRATADAVSGRVTLNVTAAGLPRTSTLAMGMPAPAPQSPLGALFAVLALAGGGGLVLRGALARR